MCSVFSWQKRHPYPTADGSFIQPWLASGWDRKAWLKELEVLKEADMTYLILAPSVRDRNGKLSQAIYPSNLPWIEKQQHDTIEACLSAAESLGIKVFLGLNEDAKWWKMTENDREWYIGEMHRGNEIAAEIYSHYKNRYPETLHGWYFVWELSSQHLYKTEYQIFFAQAMNLQLDFLTQLDRSMPLMFCPYMTDTIHSPEETYRAWSTFFEHSRLRPGDIFCPQDAVGAGWLKLENFTDYFIACKKAAEKVEGLLMWSDVETFCQETWTSTTLDRFIRQMELVSGIVDNYITFAYSHYFSPNIVPKGYHRAYLEYLKHGKIFKREVPAPDVSWKVQDGNLHLNWEKQRLETVCGYLIYQDGKLLAKLQLKPDRNLQFELPNSFIVLNAEGMKTSIVAYDYKGNLAEPVDIIV